MIVPTFWSPPGGHAMQHALPVGDLTVPKETKAKSLTVAFITARPEPHWLWFFDSLAQQIHSWEHVEVIVIDPYCVGTSSDKTSGEFKRLIFSTPKPTIWQGPHRITKQDWWAASNARNTAICLCQTEWIAFCDDRCVLQPGWMEAVRRAMNGEYAVCGSYEKRSGMKVQNGVITHAGIVTGKDNRDTGNQEVRQANGGYWYGCTTALPLEWALNVNGYEELLDGMSFEDIPFGMMLANNGYPIRFDPSMKLIEDRTPGELGPVMRREDKGVSPNDKSHAALKRFGVAKSADNRGVNLRDVRAMLARGEGFPVPDPAFEWRDWYDGQLIREF